MYLYELCFRLYEVRVLCLKIEQCCIVPTHTILEVHCIFSLAVLGLRPVLLCAYLRKLGYDQCSNAVKQCCPLLSNCALTCSPWSMLSFTLYSHAALAQLPLLSCSYTKYNMNLNYGWCCDVSTALELSSMLIVLTRST